MPRPRTKDYIIVSLSLHREILEEIDKLRGSKSRTEFIESLIMNSKDKLDLIAEIEALKKQLEELKHENEVLKAKINLLSQRMSKEELEKQITERFEELKQLYKQSYNKWQLFGDPKAKAYAVLDVVDQLKKQGEIDEITKKAIEKLLDYAGLSKWKNEIDKILAR